jgi:poly(3-hydroxybutyrate) depolymerase
MTGREVPTRSKREETADDGAVRGRLGGASACRIGTDGAAGEGGLAGPGDELRQNNPSGLRMYVYVPDNVRASPPILLALHACQGSGPYLY